MEKDSEWMVPFLMIGLVVFLYFRHTVTDTKPEPGAQYVSAVEADSPYAALVGRKAERREVGGLQHYAVSTDGTVCRLDDAQWGSLKIGEGARCRWHPDMAGAPWKDDGAEAVIPVDSLVIVLRRDAGVRKKELSKLRAGTHPPSAAGASSAGNSAGNSVGGSGIILEPLAKKKEIQK